MAYSTTNPPGLQSCSPAGTFNTFYYKSTDIIGAVDAAGYFTNGQDLGMAVGDLVNVYDTATPLTTIAYVSAVSSTGATVVIESS